MFSHLIPTSCSPLFSMRRRMMLMECLASLTTAVCNTLFPSLPCVSNNSSRASLRALRNGMIRNCIYSLCSRNSSKSWSSILWLSTTIDHYDADLGELPVVRSRRAEVRPSITFSSSSCLSIIINMIMMTLVVLIMMILETFLRMQKNEKLNWAITWEVDWPLMTATGSSGPTESEAMAPWGWKLFEEIFLLLQTWQDRTGPAKDR